MLDINVNLALYHLLILLHNRNRPLRRFVILKRHGYEGEFDHLKTPSIWHHRSDEETAMTKTASQRHETVNRRFIFFELLIKPFRHTLEKQSTCFRAVAVITQLNIRHGAPLFEVEYHDEGRD